ncbi:LOW QUALITY PROTEIN: cancer/testis antigen 1A [Homo sapiens]|uniref:Cancer/testis antigen 1 n=1 Tax=Homo sapiens TaxID=9606 RepID=A0A0A0MTT5_HUMAN|nr:LOW QUALITY PROTEIN: cancer/testis antigen 1A [Homo sapiens]KAI4001664.1 LOW QUALITY PROTEIN: cancer/testis antigen 1A [Homo sapiens]
MQAEGRGTGGSTGDADGPGGPGIPDGPGGNAGGPGEAGATGGRGPRGAGAARASGPGGGAPRGPHGGAASGLNGCCRCGARGPESRLLEFYLAMPFATPMEAELARRSLAQDAPPLPVPGVLLKEFTVSGNILTMSVQDQDRDGAGWRSVAGWGLGSAYPHGQAARNLGTPQHRVSEQRPGTPGPPPPEGAQGDGCRGVAFNVMFSAPHI